MKNPLTASTLTSLAFCFSLAVSAAFALPGAARAADVSGAGSSAAQPLYAQWADAYRRQNGDVIRYDAVGSSEGLRRIRARQVHFGASDVALSREVAERDKLVCFPSAISGVVPVVNLPGMKSGTLRLTGSLLADIFSRRITRWDDPAIVAENAGLALPKLPIVVIARQDGSGTTYNFTDYLSKVSPAWSKASGTNFTIAWHPQVRQEKGSGGVSRAVRATPGAIGYIDYNYVKQDDLPYAQLKNRDGRFVSPSAISFSAALSNSGWRAKASFEEMLTDKPGAGSWPITMGTFVIVPQQAKDDATAIATLKFFTWAFLRGDQIVTGLDFVRLPDLVQARIYRELTRVKGSDGQPLRWNMM